MIGDTTPEAARVRWKALSRVSGQERLRQALELTDLVRIIHAEGERDRRERRTQSSRGHRSGRVLSAESTLRVAAETLDEIGIPYMVTGSLASAFYGEPRSTQGLDIVVPADEARLQDLAERLRDAGLYCDDGAVSEAVSLRGMFKAVDPTSGWKIDFIVLKETAFGQTAFDGRAISELGGVPLHLIRAEDIVVAKLEWAKLGGSERQIRDVVGVLMVQGSDLDRGYIERWVSALGLRAKWGQALALERENRTGD